METLDAIAQSRLKLLESRHLLRRIVPVSRGEGAFITRNGKVLVSFASNDYFGLSRHKQVVAAAQAALATGGAGAGASRLTGGSTPLYDELEATLARMKNTAAACVFSSGYLANTGAIPALADANDLILADKLVHACMLDGARLSGASVMRFAHNSAEHCELLLKQHRDDYQHCLILTETVFSMDGDRAPLPALSELAKQYHAWLMTDDAHGLGIMPQKNPADVQMGTLSKAVGALGGYVCASRPVVELLHNTARSLIFDTALPPAVLAAGIAALNIIHNEPSLCEQPLARARQFASLMALPVPESAIVPLILGEPEKALAASAMLEEEGYYVPAIRPPTVPPGSARLRFAFSALHTEEQVAKVAALLKARVAA